MSTSRFQVEIIHHSTNNAARDFASRLFALLACDTSKPGETSPNIPVCVWSSSGAVATLLETVRAKISRRVWIVFIDRALWEENEWSAWVSELAHEAEEYVEKHHFIPVVTEETVGAVKSMIGIRNYVFQAPAAKHEEFIHEILLSLIYFLVPEQPCYYVFLSYVRSEGKAWRDRLKEMINSYPFLQAFYDEQDLIAGAQFRQRFEVAISSAAFVAIQTDLYSSRNETTREFDFAKKHGRPIIILNALKHGEGRSYPYMGNCRTLRARNRMSLLPFMTLLLREILEFETFKQTFARITASREQSKDVKLVKTYRPPELYLLASQARPLVNDSSKGGRSIFLYPDPPITPSEINTLHRFSPDFSYLTAVQYSALGERVWSGRDQNEWQPLKGKRIQLSASPAISELGELGYMPYHFEHCLIDFARHLIALGATLVFGGGFGKNEIGAWLVRIVETYGFSERSQAAQIQARLPYPLWRSVMKKTDLERLEQSIAVSREPAPDDVSHWTRGGRSFPTEKTEAADFKRKFVWARSLSATRASIASDVHAVVLIGGKPTGYVGKYPGVIEEALQALSAGKPLYTLGYLGGCAHRIALALTGQKETRWDDYAGFKPDPESCAFLKFYNERCPEPDRADFDLVRDLLAGHLPMMNNGLLREENKELGCSTDLMSSLELVTRGLIQKFTEMEPSE